MKVGDLVKMNKGYSPLGIVTKIQHWTDGKPNQPSKVPVHIEWPDGKSVEKAWDLEVINECR
jgi:hypothetical protein